MLGVPVAQRRNIDDRKTAASNVLDALRQQESASTYD